MHDVIIQILRAVYQIPDDARIGWRFHLEGILTGKDTGLVMSIGADAAKPLHHQPCIPRIPTFQDGLDSPPEGDTAPGILDHVAVIDFNFYS